MSEEELRYYSGVDEVELTDKLIKELVDANLWGDEMSLKQLRLDGGKWNVRRNSVTFPAEPI